MRIAVIGGGGWGLALTQLLAGNGHQLMVWEHNPEFLKTLIHSRSNPLLLPSVTLPESVRYTGDFAALAEFQPQIAILATPSQFLRSTLRSIPAELRDELWLDPGPGCGQRRQRHRGRQPADPGPGPQTGTAAGDSRQDLRAFGAQPRRRGGPADPHCSSHRRGGRRPPQTAPKRLQQ